MARQYAKSKKGQMVTIHGFEEMIEILQQMEKTDLEQKAKETFDDCCTIIKESMDKFTNQSLPADLANKQAEFKTKEGNVFMYSYGFSRGKDLDAFLKACYLNYGTPRRRTAKGANRGKIEPRYFISNGKRAAAAKIRARKRKMMKELMGELKK